MSNLLARFPAVTGAALVDPRGLRFTFPELRERVGTLAGGLVDLGLRPGDRVSLLLPMGVDLYLALLAVFHVGATAILVDPSGPMQDNLRRARPVAMIGVPRAHLLRLTALRGLGLAISTGFTPFPHRRLAGVRGAPPPLNPGHHPALITFTTGTTGRPKAMARGHDFLGAQHEALRHHMDLGPGDVDLPTLPVFLLHSLACGATAVLADADLRHPGSVDPVRIVAQMRREQVTTSSGSPAFFERVSRHLEERSETLPLRKVFVGGARVPATLLRRLCKVMPDAGVFVVYGSTEAEPIAVLDARSHLDELETAEREGRGALVGEPVPGVAVHIEGDEIQVSGAHVNTGYLDEEHASNKVRRGGRVWHRTGDMGRMDELGRLWLMGRERVAGRWPLEVEGAAEAFPFVRQAGLVDLGGEAVIACVLDDPPPTWERQLRDACGARAVRVPHLPTDPRHNAKVDRAALRALVGGHV